MDEPVPEGAEPNDSAGFIAVAAGWDHSCGVMTDRTAICWGGNDFGESDAPEGEFTSISTGSRHSCRIKDSRG